MGNKGQNVNFYSQSGSHYQSVGQLSKIMGKCILLCFEKEKRFIINKCNKRYEFSYYMCKDMVNVIFYLHELMLKPLLY